MSKPIVVTLASVAIILGHLAVAKQWVPLVELAFKAYDIVPDVVIEPPMEFLNVTFQTYGLKVNAGNILSPTQVKKQPTVEWNGNKEKLYTLIMTDPDVPSRYNHRLREFVHWMVVNIPGKNITKGDVLAEFFSPKPAKNTGLHRYVLLVYQQNVNFNITRKVIKSNTTKGRAYFRVMRFVVRNSLDAPVAGNFFRCKCC